MLGILRVVLARAQLGMESRNASKHFKLLSSEDGPNSLKMTLLSLPQTKASLPPQKVNAIQRYAFHHDLPHRPLRIQQPRQL